MSDELVKRLRSCAFTGVSNQQVVYVDKSALEQAADCIEALTAKLAKAVEAFEKIDALTDQLAKEVEAFEKLARLGNGDRYGNSDGNMIARTALAEIEGEKT